MMNTDFLKGERWFQHKGDRIAAVEKFDRIPLTDSHVLGIFKVTLAAAGTEFYLIPEDADKGDFCSMNEPEILKAISSLLSDGHEIKTTRGTLFVDKIGQWEMGGEAASFEAIAANSTNSLILCKKNGRPRLVVKLLRRLAEGENIEASIGKFLSTRTSFRNSPTFRGGAIYRTDDGQSYHIATIFDHVENEGNAWEWTARWLASFMEEGLRTRPVFNPEFLNGRLPLYGRNAKKMGEVLASLHIALASGMDDEFTKKPVRREDIEDWKKSWLAQADRVFTLLKRLETKNPDVAAVVEKENTVRKIFMEADGPLLDLGWKIRQHGDFHLGQVLVSNESFFIIDFEGEPLKSCGERTISHPALKDVAGMLRSFSYASFAACLEAKKRDDNSRTQGEIFNACKKWEEFATVAFLDGYCDRLSENGADFVPISRRHVFDNVLKILMLDKALYEIEYEIRSRPDWLAIPLGGIKKILENPDESRNFHK